MSDRHDNRVDLLSGLRGLDRLALSRSITVPFLGGSLRVIGREDFIAMKCFAGGPQDIADAVQALKMSISPSTWSCYVGLPAALEGRPQTCWRSCCGCDERPGDPATSRPLSRKTLMIGPYQEMVTQAQQLRQRS